MESYIGNPFVHVNLHSLYVFVMNNVLTQLIDKYI
jgi:hypothetical protein